MAEGENGFRMELKSYHRKLTMAQGHGLSDRVEAITDNASGIWSIFKNDSALPLPEMKSFKTGSGCSFTEEVCHAWQRRLYNISAEILSDGLIKPRQIPVIGIWR